MSLDHRILNSRKRARTDGSLGGDDAPTALTNLKPDEEVWLDDGNVVIGAETTGFRVHRSVLSLHSDVLRDMFTLPPPTDHGQEMMEGYPVVRVSDTAADMRHMLKALYGGSEMLSGHKTKAEFKVLAALLRLAHKYQIDKLRDGALERLKALYVDDFMSYVIEGLETYPWLTFDRLDPFEVVQLARLTQTLTLLPAALYLCCADRIFEYHTPARAAALRADNNHHNDTGSTGPDHKELVYRMPQEDLVRCLAARPSLMHAGLRVFAETMTADNDGCTSRLTCNRALNFAFKNHSKWTLLSEECEADVRCLWSSFVHLEVAITEGHELCHACFTYYKQRDLTARQRIWNNLPSYFDLDIPEWPTC